MGWSIIGEEIFFFLDGNFFLCDFDDENLDIFSIVKILCNFYDEKFESLFFDVTGEKYVF